MLLDTIERCYFGFRRRRRDVRQATSCECNACVRIPDLDLKFVVHHGAAILQKVAGRQELLGSDVIVAHRLLKNEVVEKLGIARLRPHQPGVHRRLRPRSGRARACASTPRPTTGSARCRCWVHDLERRWQEEEARGRVRVDPGGGHPRHLGADQRAAAGGLGVPHQARPADDLAAVGDGGRRSKGRPADGAGSARPTTACTARTPSSRRSSTGGRTTTSPTGRSSTRPADR